MKIGAANYTTSSQSTFNRERAENWSITSNKTTSDAQQSRSDNKARIENGQTASVNLSLSSARQESSKLSAQSIIFLKDGIQTVSSEFLAAAISQTTESADFTVKSILASNNGPLESVQEISVNSTYSVVESETVSFNAQGQVSTDDGRLIDFQIAFEFQRETSLEQMNLFTGNVDLIDPLMINFTGQTVELSDQIFEFDLNADGHNDSITQTKPGTGYLVFDKNGNGQIDDGNEMFGPATGAGYLELSRYDDDGNGWIDENDSVFNQLQLMTFDEDGAMSLLTLADAQLGALSLGHQDTHYNIYDSSGELQGEVTHTGFAFSDSGQALLMQEVKLKNFMHQPSTPFLQSDSDAEQNSFFNPLAYFQNIDAKIIAERDADTQVSIVNNAPPPVSIVQNAPLQRSSDQQAMPTTASISLIASGTTEPTLSRVDFSLDETSRQAIVERFMKNLEFTQTQNSIDKPAEPKPVVEPKFQFLDDLKAGLHVKVDSVESAGMKLEMMIYLLKNMRTQQQSLTHQKHGYF